MLGFFEIFSSVEHDENAHRNEESTNIIVKKRDRLNVTLRPYKGYNNWVRGYQIPWTCFMEISMLILYFLLGYLHQRSTIAITLDFSKAVNQYFLSGFNYPENDNGMINKNTPIYFKSEFLMIVNETGYRFLTFHFDFLCSNIFLSNEKLHMDISYEINQTTQQIDFLFDSSNISKLYNIVKSFSTSFNVMNLWCTYHMSTQSIDCNELLTLRVETEYKFNKRSRIITTNAYHNRIPRFGREEQKYFLKNPLITIPTFIIIFAIFCIFNSINYAMKTYSYSYQKATSNFQNPRKFFISKFDKWSVYSIICHTLSIVASLTYIFNQDDYDDTVPISMILMSVSSFMHCILLIRYLRLNSTVMIIVNVTAQAIWKIAQFLVGGIIIFFAFLILGCSFFGTYDETFASLIGGAESILAVIHGDSIQNMFDTAAKRSDISQWYGIIFWLMWIFFSLTIMFNISISIFEEVLTKEIYRAAKEAQKKEEAQETANNRFSLAIPISYNRIY